MAREINHGHLSIGNFDAFRISIFFLFGTNFEPCIRCRRGDQLDDRAVAAQGFAAPIDRDKWKEAMLDLVQLAQPFHGFMCSVSSVQPDFPNGAAPISASIRLISSSTMRR